LIFFGKELFENQIQNVMQKLHGSNNKKENEDNIHCQQLQKINDILIECSPPLSLYFSKAKEFNCEKMPGYIIVPALSFSVHELA
jgi:hypothetical protein